MTNANLIEIIVTDGGEDTTFTENPGITVGQLRTKNSTPSSLKAFWNGAEVTDGFGITESGNLQFVQTAREKGLCWTIPTMVRPR